MRRIVGEIGADAEAGRDAATEVAVQLDCARQIQAVGKHQPLTHRVDAQLLVMRDGFFTPDKRIAGIVAQAVEQLGEIQVEIGEKGIHADHVGQRDTEITAIFLHPAFQRRLLEIAQAETERLIRLQVFVRHSANWRQPIALGEQHVRGAAEIVRQRLLQRAHHFVVPSAGITPAQAEIEEHERLAAVQIRSVVLHQPDLVLQPLARAGEDFLTRRQAAEIQLVDDIQHENLEAHHMHQRATSDDLQLFASRAHLDETALEAEYRQEIDEIALDEAQAAQVIQLVLGEAELA